MGITRTGRTYLTAKARDYRAAVKKIIEQQHQEPIVGFFYLIVKVYTPDRRKRDIGNLDKCLADALQHAGLFADDYYIDDAQYIRARDTEGRIIVLKGGRVVVSIATKNVPEEFILWS